MNLSASLTTLPSLSTEVETFYLEDRGTNQSVYSPTIEQLALSVERDYWPARLPEVKGNTVDVSSC